MTGREQQPGPGLAETLKQLRKAANLSGERLAVRCSMSQSKISRIERGRILPSVVDVERILKALDVPTEIGRELVALARRANVQHTSWRAVAELGIWRKQVELKALAESSTVVRQFLPAVPSGLIQTEEYARLALTPMVDGRPARNVEQAVRARMDSQQVLWNETRSFHFLLTEQAVRWGRASPDVMARQCAYMADVSQRPNVHLAIVPWRLTTPGMAAPFNVFVVYDDRLVTAELFSGEVVLRDPRDISYHLNLFAYFLENALTGDDATAFLRRVESEFMHKRD